MSFAPTSPPWTRVYQITNVLSGTRIPEGSATHAATVLLAASINMYVAANSVGSRPHARGGAPVLSGTRQLAGQVSPRAWGCLQEWYRGTGRCMAPYTGRRSISRRVDHTNSRTTTRTPPGPLGTPCQYNTPTRVGTGHPTPKTASSISVHPHRRGDGPCDGIRVAAHRTVP